MTRFPDMLHRALFKSFSLFGRRSHEAALRRYFDWWHRRPDPWRLATDAYEQRKYRATLGALPDDSYRRILEAGCAEGVFTELLAATYPDAEIVGLDISERALERARQRNHGSADRVRFVHADILDHDPRTDFDLVVCAETLYYLGGGDRLRHASDRLASLLTPGGILVLVHPWPEATRLHRFADAAPGISKIDDRVEQDAQRPFAVSLYRASAGDTEIAS